jgi:uncharacterized protein with von Willebrand factor type A (vWA) domain
MSISTFSPINGRTNKFNIIENRKRMIRSEPEYPKYTEDSNKRQCGSSRMLDRFIANITTNKQSNLSAFIESICNSKEIEDQYPEIVPELKTEEQIESVPTITDVVSPFLLQSSTKSSDDDEETQTESDKEEEEEEVESEKEENNVLNNFENEEISTNDDEPSKELKSNLDEI